MEANEVLELPDGGAQAVLSQWRIKYPDEKKLADSEKYKSWKITTSKDAQHAIEAIERCKTARTAVSDDLKFFIEWQQD